MPETVIIAGKLTDEELKRSIDKLVEDIDEKMGNAADKFGKHLDTMQSRLKDFSTSISSLKNDVKDMSSSFDNIAKSTKAATTGSTKANASGYAPNTSGNALLGELEQAKKEAEQLRRNFSEFDPQLKQANRQIERLKQRIKEAKTTPLNLQDIMGMNENSINAIAAKLRALKGVTVGNAEEQAKVGAEYQRLKKLQAELMGSNAKLLGSNNALARSFGYIRNRIVYAFTIGAVINFAKNLYNVRAEYEMLDRSIGILIGDMERGTQIFNELNEMALKSPFTLIELGTAAKQLTAYNFAADEVVDVTRRLADISAALGVPMERLTYNLGQIKAQGVLNARDARDFANAGFAIVPMLAQLYNTQKTFGDELVTTGKVYDMMSKKMVTYSDVLKVIYKATDEGGKFFDFQAKQADTLRVQLANLTLAFNNMLNEIGSEHQSALAAPIKGLKLLYQNWREVWKAIKMVIAIIGAYKAAAVLSRIPAMLAYIRDWAALAINITRAKDAMALFNITTKANPIGLVASALAAVIGYFVLFRDNVEEVSAEVEMFGESGAKTLSKIETLRTILKGTNTTSSTYKKTLSELSTITNEYGVILDVEKAKHDDVNRAIEQTIQLVKEESAERQRANQIAKGEESYQSSLEAAKNKLYKGLKEARQDTNKPHWFTAIDEVQDNAEALAEIIPSIVQQNISLIAGKTNEEYEKGLENMFSLIQDRMRAIGISEEAVSKEWLRVTLTGRTNIIDEYIRSVAHAANEQSNFNEKVQSNYEVSKKATEATMTWKEKLDAQTRALMQNANDATTLYNEVKKIVDLAQKKYNLQIDLKLAAEQPPKWMLDMKEGELSKWAARFAALSSQGIKVKGHEEDNEFTSLRAIQYASAARIKEDERIRKERAKEDKSKDKSKKQNDVLLDSMNREISLVKKLQGEYDKLTKAGMNTTEALELVQNTFGGTIEEINKVFKKYGLPEIDLSIIKGKDPNATLAFFEKLRNELESKGLSNLKRINALDAIISELRVSAKTYNLDMITKGLNNELSKLKEEYELGVELDANPELGSLMLDMFNIPIETLPRTVKEYSDRATDLLNKFLKQKGSKLEIPSLLDLTDDDIRAFEKQVDEQTLSEEWVEKIKKNWEEVRAFRKKDWQETISGWNNLLEKYAEYEYKSSQIAKEANKERTSLVKKFGNEKQVSEAILLQMKIDAEEDPNKKQKLTEQLKGIINDISQGNNSIIELSVAIDNREAREQAKLSFEEFQKTPDWIIATGDLATLTQDAIGELIERIQTYKKQAKNLDPKEIKKINKALKDLKKEQRKGSPFAFIANAIADAKERASEYDESINKTVSEINDLNNVQEKNGSLTEEQAKRLEVLKEKLRLLKEAQDKVGKVNATTIVSGINEAVAVAQQATQAFGEMADALGGKGLTKSAQRIKEVVGILEKAGQGAAIGAQIGGGYGAIIGGIAGGLTGIVTTYADEWSGNKSITRKIIDSEREVKRLELIYIDLQHAIDEAYGSMTIGAQKAALANKELQLAELKRQLVLEQSRKSKNRDEDKILELQKQIKDLEYDIKETTDDIVNDLLGISKVGDAMETLMDGFIEALRNGEDAMKVFDESVDDMIANMVKKMFVTKILQPWFEQQWNAIQQDIDARGSYWANMLNRQKEQLEGVKGGDAYRGLGKISREDAIKQLEDDIAQTEKKLVEETTPTLDDIKRWAALLRSGQPIMEGSIDGLNQVLQELGLFTDKVQDKNLTAMQQGIQGVTEVTANALEAYMNGVSQQVYYQSDVLTQIRDAMINFNMDAQVGTMSQILLQLQSSYTVQMSIQGILEGVLNPSGRAFNVELVS